MGDSGWTLPYQSVFTSGIPHDSVGSHTRLGDWSRRAREVGAVAMHDLSEPARLSRIRSGRVAGWLDWAAAIRKHARFRPDDRTCRLAFQLENQERVNCTSAVEKA